MKLSGMNEEERSSRMSKRALLLSSLCLGLGLLLPAYSQKTSAPFPASTTLPVRFVNTIDTKSAKPGDVVKAKTIQSITLPDGEVLPKGTLVEGEVVKALPFTYNPKPYTPQAPALLALRFTQIEQGRQWLPVNMSVRALAGALAAEEATTPRYPEDDEIDAEVVLIGGDHFSPWDSKVFSYDGEIVGYLRKNGVFARLQASDYVNTRANLHCDATKTEQAVGVFSPNACGLYGFDSATYLAKNGSGQSGAVEIYSTRHNVELNSGSVALLEVQAAN